MMVPSWTSRCAGRARRSPPTAPRGARATLSADRAAVILYDDDGAAWTGRVVAVDGENPADDAATLPSDVAGHDLEIRRGLGSAVAVAAAAEPQLAAQLALPVHRDAGSLLLIPLDAGGRGPHCVLTVVIREERVFSDDEVRFAATLGATIGAALIGRQARLEARRVVEYVDTLGAVVAATGGVAQPSALGLRVMTILCDALSLTGGVMYVVDEDEAHLRAIAHLNLNDEAIAATTLVPLSTPRLATEAVRTGRPAFGGTGVSVPPGTIEALARVDARGYAVLPLSTRDRVIGVVTLFGPDDRAFSEEERALLTTAAGALAMALDNARLYAAAERTTVETIEALAGAIEARDGYTGEHCEHMAARATALARALALPDEEIATIRLGAVLHDIGKIGVPDAVLNKPGRLDPDEFAVMKRHPAIGARIVGAVEGLRALAPLVRHHHERYDGAGYPDGLAGDDIPIGARVLAVVDTYGAMTEDRVYRRAPGHARAVAVIGSEAGAQFDPHVARAFLHLLGEDPALETAAPAMRVATTDARPAPPPPISTERRARVAELAERDILLSPHTSTEDAVALFEREPERAAVAVGEEGAPRAILTRQTLFAKLSGLYGNALYRKRPVARVAETDMLLVDAAVPPEEAVRRATARPAARRYDPLVVMEGGRYVGLVAVFQLLDRLNDEALRRARLSNPLSGLPGAPLLEGEIDARVAARAPLTLVLADIDGFKPYNDHYGLARGDEVLLMVARLLQEVVAETGGGDLVGHVGGDDFVVLSTPERAPLLRARVAALFAAAVPRYYDPVDLTNGGIVAADRADRRRFHGLLSISVVAVDASEVAAPDYLTLTQEATRRKLVAKRGEETLPLSAQTVA